MAGRTVTRAQLSEAVYQEVGLSRNESAELVETVLDEISDALARGEMVKISSFGSFSVRQKGQRVGRNPKTGEEVPIMPRRVLVFRTISEVATELDVPQHVLRFWETKFPQIRPLKRGGGRRYYRPEDVELLRRIQSLLYKEGYTIKGVQRLLREPRGGAVGVVEEGLHPPDEPV